MTENEAIDLLRYALAAIWTEIEGSDNHDDASWNCHQIADEALAKTIEWAKPKTLGPSSHLKGMESWEHYCK